MPTLPPARLLAACLLLIAPAARADGPTGEAIYKQQCAWCHGKAGEGAKRHKDPLAGDLPVPKLADVIRKTMPENDPESLSAEDARKVAEYVHGAFYSKEARERNAPPRVELSRLTVRQYENAVADLVGSFRQPTPPPDDRRGLRAEYFNGRDFRNNKRAVERTDEQVAFDFKDKSPVPGKVEPHEFAIRWQGSVLAPVTGRYEFTVKSDQAVRLWVNDPLTPLVDAYVKSGNDTEFRGTVNLLAGRAYHLRLEFSKAKQGVQDKKAKERPPAPAFVSLLWKPPAGVAEPIPSRCLSPLNAPEVYVSTTPFPPDDRSLGWERGNTVSKAWDSATTDAALEAAGYVAAHLNELAGVSARREAATIPGNPGAINTDDRQKAKPAADREAKLKAFARRFVERASRRPLTDEQAKVIDRQFARAAGDPEAAAKRVVLFALKSPRFLYREDGGQPDGYTVASRLSFALWDSLPDQKLLDAAKAGKLTNRDEVAKQAERMLADPRTKEKVRGFLHHWLRVDHVADMAKDAKRFPGFDAAAVADLRTSLDLFLDEVVWSDRSDFRELLLGEGVYLNDRLARLYGTEEPEDGGFEKVPLDPGKRAGVLTHPMVMAAFAYTGASSPIHRGVFLARGVLGLTLRPPQDAFSPLAEDLHPTLTTRERTILQTSPAGCVSCHIVINPLGFTLENFDAIGRFREKDNNKPVDPTGGYTARDGTAVTFRGPAELAKYLAASPDVHGAFVEQLVHHLVQQPVRAYGPGTLGNLREKFAANGYNIRKLAVEVAATAALAGTDRTASLK